MTDYISPYLLKPLRSLEEAKRDLGQVVEPQEDIGRQIKTVAIWDSIVSTLCAVALILLLVILL